MKNSKGFTLIELVIVVVIIGILAAIAIPNILESQDRIREGSVKSNMHTLQIAVEDFAVQNSGTYPGADDEKAVIALMPGGTAPDNPFTGKPCEINWGSPASSRGNLGYEFPGFNEYDISGYGDDTPISFQLSNH